MLDGKLFDMHHIVDFDTKQVARSASDGSRRLTPLIKEEMQSMLYASCGLALVGPRPHR
jgi:hypothetical protein